MGAETANGTSHDIGIHYPNGNVDSTPHKFDPTFTRNVINATGPKASPRMRKVMGSLIQHLHDFCRENEITVDEWMKAVDLVCFSPVISPTSRNGGRCGTIYAAVY